MKACIHTNNLYMSILDATPNSQTLERLPCSSVARWINEVWYTHRIEYGLAIKGMGTDHATALRALEAQCSVGRMSHER